MTTNTITLLKSPVSIFGNARRYFRESIYTYLEEGERPVTLASLTYIDQGGVPFIRRLIESRGCQRRSGSESCLTP
ncbi:hypothetical protein PO124_10930 [Bacillus licheniformis]|nr:hypothetical protein [Bacillus licheniformis]